MKSPTLMAAPLGILRLTGNSALAQGTDTAKVRKKHTEDDEDERFYDEDERFYKDHDREVVRGWYNNHPGFSGKKALRER